MRVIFGNERGVAAVACTVALPGLRMEKSTRVQGLRASLCDALTPGYRRTPLRGVPATISLGGLLSLPLRGVLVAEDVQGLRPLERTTPP